MTLTSRGIKILIGIFALLIIVVVVLFFIFNFILFVLPFVIIMGLAGYCLRMLNKFKKEKPKEKKVLDVEYNVKKR